MKDEFPSLLTPSAQAGLSLATALAEQLHAQIESTTTAIPRPGGMNFLLPSAVPREITAGILFYAIAAANRGWPGKSEPAARKDSHVACGD